jgi:hypothetical protein
VDKVIKQNIIEKEIKMKTTKILLAVSVISVMLSMGGSSAMAQPFKDYGSIQPSNAVTRAFDSRQVNPDLDYYVSGPDESPDVIIGVNRGYSLDSTLWKKVAVAPDALKDMISSMQSEAAEESVVLHGFNILSNEGMAIGVWYSPLDNPTYVKMESDKMVDIPTPNEVGRLSTLANLSGD